MATKKPENMSFEASIEELDTLVEQLENGDLALEDALKKFERGIALARASQSKLEQAEQRVSILLEQGQNAPLDDFQSEPES
ncbi:exodeoxyribonuclease VII small subunit [Vibrio sp. WXL103]|uniref:exodeoxyribonuclease VII small subunit n=1 Tax=unclassified Vibrio TaxID=2614977 RepID=UPI003EC56033